jgi:hypothetical protein
VTTRTTKGVLAGVGVAAVAAACVTAVIRYRLGQQPTTEDRVGLDALATRLDEADGFDKNAPPAAVGRMLGTLQRTHGLSTARLRQWIAGVREGTLTPEQATVAESDLGILEREADQVGL